MDDTAVRGMSIPILIKQKTSKLDLASINCILLYRFATCTLMIYSLMVHGYVCLA